MSTNDAVSREAVKEAIETWWQEKKWHSRWLRRLFRAIDQLPPLQPDGPRRSREEIENQLAKLRECIERAYDAIMEILPAYKGLKDLLFVEQEEEPTDGKR